MTIAETRRHLTLMLQPAVGSDEASAMASAIIEDIKGYKPVDVALYGHRELLPETVERMERVAEKVVAGEPLQYALGTAYFRGRHFSVTPATLIPRPETAQLVDMIVSDFTGRSDLRVLDIGTGTGCIAISLALDLPFAQVDAIDISTDALKVAQVNAEALKAKSVRFVEADALRLTPGSEKYDIIVSNPPYVLESEKA
ncbi:MAG: peptide chain release factor N(5)-glutamine methyltransferase [Muribaculaceae bacterium]|nr:peptide chain release factor N(5)-glutamine methyltransferase [Muribaculaceae bacterium]